MCGIVGYVGKRNAVPILIKGLEHLEYRGYDSAGIACLDHEQGNLFIVKDKGKVGVLKEQLEGIHLECHTGIGHTRWATHGEPSRANAHPHTDASERIALIHNGIIENYSPLKVELRRQGYRFRSETDTEVSVHLIASFYKKGNLTEAFCRAIRKLHGFFAFVVMSKDEPDKLFAFKRSNPLIIGLGIGENFIASDVTAFLSYTNRVLFLEDDEYAIVSPSAVEIYSLHTKKPVARKPTLIRWNISEAQKGGYPHFMLKEIFEQPRILEEIISKRLDSKGNIVFDTFSKAVDRKLKSVKKIYLVSCGTAYHAGLVGYYMMGHYLKLPVQASISSEFRYENPVVGPDDLVILITQSGETADTLAALRLAKEKKAATLAIVNVLGSTIAREADMVIYTQAGPEIGVASTKAYIAQLAILAFLAFYMARLRFPGFKKECDRLIQEFKKLSSMASKVLKQEKAIEKCAKKHYHRRNFLYLGRGYNFPTALEGALKLKEISYIHAEGYPAGEMKHGPIALVDREMPVIAIAPKDPWYDKMYSQIEQAKSRGGKVVAVATDGDDRIAGIADHVFWIPEVPWMLTPVLTVIPLQ
ncbi:MAG: glutamine--fructose-6-phosphate transaminase (isomerizing), partial [Candidatus Omnitrophica bacterium]|nr:glutamine--fructose-6-phosphate transaminase (isomerizing) [Candidatus Omnitrophota bacterium]